MTAESTDLSGLTLRETTTDTGDVCSGPFQQTPFWAKFKAGHGWTARRFSVIRSCSDGTEREDGMSVLLRTFGKPPLKFTVAYIPMFPSFSMTGGSASDPDSGTAEFAAFIRDIALALGKFLPRNTLCVRFDPDVEFSSPELRDRFNSGMKLVSFADRLGIRKNRVDIQPPDSTYIDLALSQEQILAAMKPKWRYNVRLASRKGVQVRRISADSPDFSGYLDSFYEIYRTTAGRDGIAIHAKSYYEDLLRLSAECASAGGNSPSVSLYVAEHEGDRLAAIITLFSPSESVYLYGCSSNEKRSLMPAYILQWTAICDAKEAGSLRYDLYGMPPTDDPSHPMHGLYLFKTGFGGVRLHRPGTFDVPLSLMYGPFCLAEAFRAFWHKKVLKKIRGR